MSSPTDEPEGDWWNREVNRRETIWLGLGGLWSLFLFGWMSGWTRVGDQNPIGETYEVEPEAYREDVKAFQEEAEEVERGLVPADDEVYVGAMRYAWDGLPVVLERGREYEFHIGSYDVQHGFSIRKGDNVSKHANLQALPGYEWVVPMTFDETGEYHVLCNEFCGHGHRTMHGTFYVEEA